MNGVDHVTAKHKVGRKALSPSMRAGTVEMTSKPTSTLRPDCIRVLNEENVADAKLEPKLSKQLLKGPKFLKP